MNAERRIATAFGVTTISAVALAAVYANGGQPQAEGALLATALGGLAYGFVTWANRLLPPGPVTQQREPVHTEQQAVKEDLDRAQLGRRKLLTRTLGLAAIALGAAAAFPIRSLGPSPGDSLKRTPWRRGTKAVGEDGAPVRADDIPVGGFLTVFPEGHVDSADGQAVLIRLDDGLVAYSKVCTHAGCPVGLYQAESHQLICPCHQSAFDVLDAARPVFGPATRRLPHLPIAISSDGAVFALGDFDEPIGPAYWNRR
jgi:ubiquinol-cytochrome c reductase iron-sulfur subunit